MTYRCDDVFQERAKACEVNHVGLRPNDPVREDPLAVVLIGIEVVSGIKCLAIDNRRLDRVAEKSSIFVAAPPAGIGVGTAYMFLMT